MGPSGVIVEPAPGAWSSDLHSRLFLYLVHPFPAGPWKSALGTSNPGSWYKQRQNDLCRGQGFSEEGGHRGGRQVPVPRALLSPQGCLGDESTTAASGGTGVSSRPAGP